MGHNEPDEAEQADDRDGARGKESRHCREQDARALDGEADAARHIITELQDVEPLRCEKREPAGGGGIGQEHLDVGPAARRESAHHPHECTVHAVAV